MPLLKYWPFYTTYAAGLISGIFWSVWLLGWGWGKGDLHPISPLTALDWPPPLLSPAKKGRSLRKVLHFWKLEFLNSCNTTGHVVVSYYKNHQGLYGLMPNWEYPQCDKIILFKFLMILKVYQARLLAILKE